MATAATDTQRRLRNQPASIFQPGRNCWRVSHAARAAFLIDADNYFSALTEAAAAAQRSIYIAGWDFHSRTRLRVEPLAPHMPTHLGDFLNHLAHARRDLRINVLIWDFPLVFGLDREWSPLYGLGWRPHHRIDVRFDNTHPTGGSHHQKLVVIDDAIAFCGGIDLTCKRWDTSLHAASNPHRVTNAVPYPPMHDAMIAVDGEAAQSLGDLFRERWQHATGDELKSTGELGHRWRHWPLVRRRHKAAAAAARHPWPASLPIDVENVPVAISRTQAPRTKDTGVREIEALYLDMIGAARRTIYIENQYFTASKVADALAARLSEPEGPEVIIVLRELSHGWLEELTMQTLRTKLIEQLRTADQHQRLRVYCPFIEGLAAGTCIDVHAKLIVVDDDWLRIGSANLANRSMGLDTECDVTIEALGREAVRTAIRRFRERLIAEHLGTDAATFGQSVTSTGSLRAAIDQLQRPERTLKPLTDTANVSDAVLSMISVADPEKPIDIDELTELFVPEEAHAPKRRHPWRNLGIAAGVLLLLTLMWRYTPLADWATAGHITRWARAAGDKPWVAVAIVFAYLAGSLVMFPRPLITLFAVLAFGPYWGFALALSGTVFAAWVPFWLGRRLDRSFVRRIAGSKLDPIVKALRRKGLWAVTALRLVPLAPFIIANIVAGTIRIRPRDYLLGTLFGMLPGVLVSTIFSGQVRAGLEDGANINYLLIAAAVLVFALGIWAVRRWLLHSSANPAERR